ncbi:MAG: CHAD domain-containing protein [Nannocystaceae bacterium]|nr:CHAD domain-containing protein [bacterium]
MTPPTTRALARRVAAQVLERVTTGAEQLAEALRPALPVGVGPIEVEPAPSAPPPPPPPVARLEGADLGWALARHVSAGFDVQLAALTTEAVSADAHDAEAVRRMRVASRRLRSLVQLFGPWLGKKRRRRVLRDLKAITAALGPVRDVDVVLGELERCGRSDPLRTAAAEQIAARVSKGHARTRRRAAKALARIELATVRDDLLQARRRIVERLTAESDVRPTLASMLDEASAHAFAKTPVPTTLDDREAVHDVRIIAKRLRYAHVWVKPAMQDGPGPRRLLKRVQRAVGDARDVDLLIERLRGHEAALRDEGQRVLADAIATWRSSAEARRAKTDSKILPALSDLSHRAVCRLTREGMGLAT